MLREFRSQKVFSKRVCGQMGRRGWAKIEDQKKLHKRVNIWSFRVRFGTKEKNFSIKKNHVMCQRSRNYLLKVRPGTMVSWCLKASRAWIRHWIWHRSGSFGCYFHLVFPHTTWSLSIFSISLVETGHNENTIC